MPIENILRNFNRNGIELNQPRPQEFFRTEMEPIPEDPELRKIPTEKLAEQYPILLYSKNPEERERATKIAMELSRRAIVGLPLSASPLQTMKEDKEEKEFEFVEPEKIEIPPVKPIKTINVEEVLKGESPKIFSEEAIIRQLPSPKIKPNLDKTLIEARMNLTRDELEALRIYNPEEYQRRINLT